MISDAGAMEPWPPASGTSDETGLREEIGAD
jgi:hypothetical protein